MTRSRQTIKAGEFGTKKFVNKYGKNLVTVRYYYDIKKEKENYNGRAENVGERMDSEENKSKEIGKTKG